MTTFSALISGAELAASLSDPDWAVVDCRFTLNDPPRGQRDYLQAHIPGAVYAHLDEDLSAPIVAGVTGRHPLPTPEAMARVLGRLGIDSEVQVVAYDDHNGGIAARLWWILQWLGHARVAVLDGGWATWQRQQRPTQSGAESRMPRRFSPQPDAAWIAEAADILALGGQARTVLMDARAPERFRGDVEPIDAVAGHIPGALCVPYLDNVNADGTFRSQAELHQRFKTLLGDTPAAQVICYCGSGVTAAQNVLAIQHAGLGQVRLYPGSWSEWITDPARPTASGPV